MSRNIINVYYTPAEPTKDLTIYTYQTGNFLNIFSGSYISATSGCTISDFGIGVEDTVDQYVFSMTMNDNSYVGSGEDISYEIIVHDYYRSMIIGDYSASSLGDMNPYTLGELFLNFIG